MSKSYFPFETCEKPHKDKLVAQPYSAFINAASSAIVLYYALYSKHIYSQIFLLCVFAFTAFHAFSHTYHVSGSIQKHIIHLISYGINASLLYLLYRYSGKAPSTLLWFALGVLVVFDLYAVFCLPTIFYMTSQWIIFLGIFAAYYNFLPKSFQQNIAWLFIIGIFILSMVWNESQNCDTLLEQYPNIPFHLLIEIPGLIFFYLVASQIYRL
jgi:hypothetical protein